MNSKFLATCLAPLALCVAGGSVSAAISTGQVDASDPTRGELFLSVYDAQRGVSYTRDLGLTLSPLFFDTRSLTFAPDKLYISTFFASDPSDLRFSLVGLNDSRNVGLQFGLLATSNVSALELAADPITTLNAVAANLTQYVDAVNAAGSTTEVAENLGVAITDSDSAGYYANPMTFNETLGSAVSFRTGANIGEPLAMHVAQFDTSAAEVTQRRFGNVWTLAVDGRLSYAPPVVADTDGDGVGDLFDNCTFAGNADQLDGDGDGFGNACDTDLNGDCITDATDLGLFRASFFLTSLAADLDGDGAVNATDLGLFRLGYLLQPGPSGLANCQN